MEYIGLDVHKQYTTACILDKETGEVNFKTLKNTRKDFETLFGKSTSQKAVIEASGTSYMVYDLIEDIVDEIQIANPSQVKAIANAAIKTDKIDAQTLANLLSADLIPQCHIRDTMNRQAIFQLRQRMYLVKMRTSLKNRIHAFIDRQAEEFRKDKPPQRDLFGKLGRMWIDGLRLPEIEAKMLSNMLRLLDTLSDLIKESDKWIKSLYDNDPVCQRLQTIPGIGKFLAVLIRFEIDTINRFRSIEKLHAFAGLVPTTSSSGGKTRHGKMIKSCNHWLKWGLIEAVWPAITHDLWLRKIYYGKKKHKHTNVAKSIVAKKILSLVYKVWKEERNYIQCDPSLMTGQP